MKSEQEGRLQQRIEACVVNSSNDVIATLTSHEPDSEQPILKLESFPTLSLLKDLAEQLTYEVRILVCQNKQDKYTLFIPGSKQRSHSPAKLRLMKIAFSEVIIDIHNHPSNSSVPTFGDFMSGNLHAAINVIICRDSICQFSKRIDQDFLFYFMDYLTETKKDVWRHNTQYEQELNLEKNKVTQMIPTLRGLEDLSGEELDAKVQSWLRTSFEINTFSTYISTKQEFAKKHFLEFLLYRYSHLVQFLTWEDVTDLQQLLTGKSLLE